MTLRAHPFARPTGVADRFRAARFGMRPRRTVAGFALYVGEIGRAVVVDESPGLLKPTVWQTIQLGSKALLTRRSLS